MNAQKHILIVDDEDQVAYILQASLQKLGAEYTVETAHDGQEALVKAAQTAYDLVITDLNMPGMDGIQLTQAIQATAPDTTVVWMTAYGSLAVKKKAGELGIEHYLPKPLDIVEIRQIARRILERVSRQQAAAPALIHTSNEREDRLRKLREETGAYCVLLITIGGQIVDAVGVTEGLDLGSLSALMAGNFLAAHEVAKLLGQENTFKLSYHESDRYKVYTYTVGTDYLLIIVFGQETRPGVVWLYARRAAVELEEILDKEPGAAEMRGLIDAAFQAQLQSELDSFMPR